MNSLPPMQSGDDVLLTVAVKAAAHTSLVLGFENNTLKISVKAVREKGKANEAIQELLGDYFHIAKSRVEIVSGHTSKIKRLLLRGCQVEDILKKVASQT
ncbi:MAG TPA: DUF167 family protein [Chlamydiales bacterium]|nr:DUF167 family protein [Chlamydiales bacterium]